MTAGSATPLRGRTAVVTGGSSGIGYATAHAFARAGARVAILARGADALRDAAARIGADTLAIPCDVSDMAAVELAVATIRKEFGGAPDILVNNAGRFVPEPLEQTSLDEFEQSLRVNATAAFAFVHAFVGDMRARGSGHLVTIGSIADTAAFADNVAYSAGKFALRGMHEVMREALRGSGVRTTLVSPGPVNTPIWDSVGPELRKGHTPRDRMLSAESVADAVRFVVTLPPEANVDVLRMSRA